MSPILISSSPRVFGNDVMEEQILKFAVKDVLKFENWLCNRQPDQDKVDEIILSIKSHSFTPQLISTFKKNSESDLFVVYDGSHRIEAFKQMLLSDEMSKILLSYLNDTILATVILSNNENYIVQRFTEINKATPLPDLYKQPLEVSTKHIRIVIPQFITQFKKLYRCHKTTAKPHLPNYNSSTLTDNLFELLISEECLASRDELTSDFLMSIFSIINSNYQQKFVANPTMIKNGISIVNKAEKYGCFVFLQDWKNDFIKIYNRINGNNLIDFE